VPQSGGNWIDWQHVVDRLTEASAYWLATVTPRGRPHVVPVWGCLVDGRLFLETGDMGTLKNRNIDGNREVQVHLDGVEDAVIVRGRGDPIVPAGDLASALARAMHDKYHATEPLYEPSPSSWDAGGLVEVSPRTVLAWKDMPTATRWRFDRG
jgi:Pyridoxamine 5'-phosphate oxidase